MDCWKGETTVISYEITGEPPRSRGHTDGPGQTQRGTDKTQRKGVGERMAGEGRHSGKGGI